MMNVSVCEQYNALSVVVRIFAILLYKKKANL